jgi:hypothetical protein
MQKRGLLLSIALTVILSAPLVAEDEYYVVPVNVSLIPAVSIKGPGGYKTINYVQLNVVAGYADRLKGTALGVVSIIGEDVSGLQAGVANWVSRDLVGAQAGVVGWVSRDLTGLQAGVVDMVLGEAKGLQAGVVNYAAVARFAQAGVVNVAGTASGLQLGIVNVAHENEGVPIGLVSLVLRGGQTHAQTWYDEMGLINLALIHGTKTVYNIYTAAVDSKFEDTAAGLGLGVHIPLQPLFLNLEGIGSAVTTLGNLFDQSELLVRARIYLGYDFKFLSLIGGVSFTYLTNLNDTDISLEPFHDYEFGFSSSKHRFWPGLFLGVQY